MAVRYVRVDPLVNLFAPAVRAFGNIVIVGRTTQTAATPGVALAFTYPRDASFVAGPEPGSTRFGNTRYYRHPDADIGRTAAIGELNESRVEREDLVPVPTTEAERYAASLPPAH